MNQQERDQWAYQLAKDFLLKEIDGLTPAILDEYLRGLDQKTRPQTIEGIFARLLKSAQNANSKTNVIGGSIGGISNLKTVLFDYDAKRILEEYENWEDLFNRIKTDLNPAGKMRKEPRSLWPSYCKTVLSSAEFMAQFETPEKFYQWADFFNHDERARPALPLLLAEQITGIGFALACDFLKEIGYVNFGKPDAHIKDIFRALSLCEEKTSDYEVFKAIIRVSQNTQKAPYDVDKVFWLIGSGDFYMHPSIGKEGKYGSQKAKFLKSTLEKMQKA